MTCTRISRIGGNLTEKVMHSESRLGMLLFLLSEAVFFVMLMLSYAYFHPQATAHSALDITRTGFFTAALIASSFTVYMVEKNIRNNAFRAWLLATIGLGALFLFGQSREYLGLIRQNITISRDLFGTTFFTLTGFHGLHVTVGVLLLAMAYSLSWVRGGSAAQRRVLANVSLYWHFVDFVWIAIFTEVYVWPRL